MSKLDELIKELCPNGVEYKSIADIFDTITDYTAAGSFKTIGDNVKYYKEENYAQLIRTTDLKSNFLDKTNFVYVDENAFKFLWRVNLNENSLIMPNIGNCGEVYFVTKDLFPNENNVLGPNAILLKTKIYNIKYFYYYFHIKIFQKQLEKITSNTGQTKFNKTDLKKILVPVPPLEVQDEIVRILDSFIALTTKLTTELTARKKQYSWYRDYLLKFENKVEKSKLSEVATIKARIGWQGLTKEEYLITGNYYLITGTDFQNGEINLKNCYYVNEERYIQDKNIQLKNDDVLVTKDGTLGKVAYVSNLDKPATLNSGIFVIRSIDTNKLLNRYLFHYLKAPYLMKYAQNKLTGGTIKHLNQNVIVDFEIPLPPLEVQKRIVEVLDNFEKICNDLNIGLPAEIEARQKQYEFYRNFLLTFKEDSVNSLRQDKIYIDS